jgi:hypothetical protein
MCGQVELTGDNGNVIIRDRPFIIVFTLIEVDKFSKHPEITPSVWIHSLIKVFHPFRIGLSADFDALEWLI